MCAKPWILIFLSFTILILLAACSTLPLSATQEPTEIIRVQITPSLIYWQPALQACALNLSGTSISIKITSPDDLDQNGADLIMRFGPKQDNETNVSILDDDRLVVVTHSGNPLKEISRENLQLIFSGEVNNWNQLIEAQNNGYEMPIHAIQFENNNDLSRVLSLSLALEKGINSQGTKVASNQDMISEVSSNPGAIGYMLESLVDLKVKVLEISDASSQAISMEQPVRAITHSEPRGSLLQLLLCLQTSN